MTTKRKATEEQVARWLNAYRLRLMGLNYEEIGVELGVSKSRARKITLRGERVNKVREMKKEKKEKKA